MDGFLSFEPLYPVGYDPSLNKDIIAPLWTKIHIHTSGNISYSQVTSGPLVKLAANEISQLLPGSKVSVSWVFISTWEEVEFEPDVGEVTFQVLLISDSENRSYVVMNYVSIPISPQAWMNIKPNVLSRQRDVPPVNQSPEPILSQTFMAYPKAFWVLTKENTSLIPTWGKPLAMLQYHY
ncbi:hypothetical protein AOLI_G00139050 [Acnodon oligacanthus]